MFEGVLGDVAPALLPDEGFQLLDARLLALYARLCLQRDPVVGVQLFLQLDDCLVSFVQS